MMTERDSLINSHNTHNCGETKQCNTRRGKQIKGSGDSSTWLTGHTRCSCGTPAPYPSCVSTPEKVVI
ncbi:hypothetical protein HKD37_14G039689 [Glycine soja]